LSKINQMAHLVLANPTITAKELAQKMGYAEQKSVYYWLDKAGYRGMKDFKKAVLSGCFQIAWEPGKLPAVRDSGKLPIPLYTDDDKLTLLDYSDFVHSRLGPGSFAVLVSEEQSGQVAGQGDILIIDPDAPCIQGSIVLVNIEGAANLARVYHLTGKSPVYIDINNPNRLLSPNLVIGKVVFVVRHAI